MNNLHGLGRKMSTIFKIGQRITRISHWKLKASLLSLLCLTTFLAFVDVRASTPSPFTTVTPLSTKGFPFPKVCTPTNGSDVQFASGHLDHRFWSIRLLLACMGQRHVQR